MDTLHNGRPRVVITGMAAITPLGTGIANYWENLKNGVSGIRRITRFDPGEIAVQVAGEVPDFEPTNYLDKKEARRLERSSQFVTAATQMAIEDAGFAPADLEKNSERTGVVMGTALAGYDASKKGIFDYFVYRRKPSPFALIAALTNMPTYYAAYTARATGPTNAITTACAAGSQAIGEAVELIRRGNVDVAFAGGVESTITDYAVIAFDMMTVLTRDYNDDPAAASRPFDADRSGFVYSEGAAMFVLESLEHACRRNARIYAEVKGFAASNDAYHIAAIDPEGKGAQRAMRWAIQDARINVDNIDYINAHGTSTRANDAIETYAIKQLFGEHAYDIPISSTKSMIGHAMGAAGAVEAVACVMTLHEQVIHPTINYTTPDPACDLDYVPNVAREAKVKYLLSNSFGLGGQNACLVLGRI
jgi:3-oxoacyl-[acyl-carrier-protein] synthase II